MIEGLLRWSLRNRLVVLAAGIAAAAGGIYAYRRLPVDAFPDVSPNLVQIFTVTEGLAPEEIEKYVTFPVESAMAGLPGVERIRSVSNFGLSVVNVYFEDGLDIYFCRQVVGERLEEARSEIPEGFGEPRMGPISTGMGLVLFYYLEDTTGTYSLVELRTLQDWLIKYALQSVPGVTEVLGIGGWEKQFHVVVHPESLLRYGVTLAEVIQRIKANNFNVGAQFIERDAEEYIVRSVGLATGVEDLERIVIKTEDGSPIYLRDLADVRIGGAIRRGVQSRNGVEEVVAGMVIKLFGTNASTVIGRVEEKLREINETLPEGVRIVPYYEQKTLVEACVRTVFTALLQGIALVCVVLGLFLGSLRASLVPAAAIPFSILVAFIGMDALELSANLMTFGGLAIAIGMLVDGTIVMVENTDRFLLERGRTLSVRDAAEQACLEVARPVAFAVLIVVVVFLPLFSLQGVEGKTFRPLAATVVLAMAGSLVFALTLGPVLATFVMRARRGGGEGPKEPALVRAIRRVYRPVIVFFVRRPRIAASLAGLLFAAGLVVLPGLGSEFTPRLQEGTIIVRLTLAPSISLVESTRVTQIVERRLLGIPEVREVVTRIGRGEVGAHTDPINSAEMYVLLEDESKWRTARTQGDIEEVIRRELGNIPGVVFNLTQPIEMTVDELLEGVRAELVAKLFGDDLEVLKEKGEEIAAVVRSVRGAADVQVDQVSGVPQLVVRVDRKAVARWGTNVQDVQDLVRAAVGGVSAGEVFEGIRRFDIYVRYREDARNTPEAIRNLLVPVAGGAKVPLYELGRVEEVIGPRQITREDNRRFIAIQCNVVGRDIGSFVAEAREEIARRVELPVGYYVTWGGQFRLQQEANRRLAFVVPITLALILVLLYGAFGSIRNAVLILLNIPLALVGGVLALAVSGENLSVPSSVGFIALFGIALENGMVLVTYLDRLVRSGLAVEDASVEAASIRLRSVLMTAVTTGLGLLPLLAATGTGSEVQRPLATVVIGGLVTSTLLTLCVLPALYRWFTPRGLRDAGAAGS